MHYSIVIPFHNEGGNLPELHRRLKNFLAERKENVEVIFIDDLSDDGGAEILQEHISDDNRFSLYALKARGGQTGAFELGFAKAIGTKIIRNGRFARPSRGSCAFF